MIRHLFAAFLVFTCAACTSGGNTAPAADEQPVAKDLAVATATTDSKGLATLSAGDNSVALSVKDESGAVVSGMSAKLSAMPGTAPMVIVYDTKGKYYPVAAWGTEMTATTKADLVVLEKPLIGAVVAVVSLVGLAYTFYKQMKEPLPIQYDLDGKNMRFCASRAWFEREADIATGVLFMGAPGGVVKEVLGVAAGKVSGFGVLDRLDAQYKGKHAGYVVVQPTNKPTCQSKEIITDLCILNDQAHGLKIWNTAPLEIKVEGPCMPVVTVPSRCSIVAGDSGEIALDGSPASAGEPTNKHGWKDNPAGGATYTSAAAHGGKLSMTASSENGPGGTWIATKAFTEGTAEIWYMTKSLRADHFHLGDVNGGITIKTGGFCGMKSSWGWAYGGDSGEIDNGPAYKTGVWYRLSITVASGKATVSVSDGTTTGGAVVVLQSSAAFDRARFGVDCCGGCSHTAYFDDFAVTAGGCK